METAKATASPPETPNPPTLLQPSAFFFLFSSPSLSSSPWPRPSPRGRGGRCPLSRAAWPGRATPALRL